MDERQDRDELEPQMHAGGAEMEPPSELEPRMHAGGATQDLRPQARWRRVPVVAVVLNLVVGRRRPRPPV